MAFPSPATILLLLHSAAVASCRHVISPNERRDEHYLSLPVVHSTNRQIFDRSWHHKRDTVSAPLATWSDIAYYVRLDMGTPAQSQFVQLDTGSFELWVNPDCSKLQDTPALRFCESVGLYDPDESETAFTTSESKTLNYGVGRAAVHYIIDHVALSDTDMMVEDIKFGMATDTADQYSGMLGLGYGEGVNINYKNFVDQLAEQNVTQTKAFSLALGSKLEGEGAIVFGGLDTSKFTGTLSTLPIITADEAPDGVGRYWINMAYMSHTYGSGETWRYGNSTMPVVLDSGATLSLLPQNLADTIALDFGSLGVDDTGMYVVDCTLDEQPGTLDFVFEGVTIQVPTEELVREFLDADGEEVCYLGLGRSDDFVLLGDTFLRSTYAVFDQTNDAVHIAQYVGCGSSEMEITPDLELSDIEGECDSPPFDHPGVDDAESLPTVTASGDLPTLTGGAVDGNLATSFTIGKTLWIPVAVLLWMMSV